MPVTARVRSSCASAMARMDTTTGPRNRPAGSHRREVRYIGIPAPVSRWRSRTPADCNALVRPPDSYRIRAADPR